MRRKGLGLCEEWVMYMFVICDFGKVMKMA